MKQGILRRLHLWVGILVSLSLLLLVLTGFGLNHPAWFQEDSKNPFEQSIVAMAYDPDGSGRLFLGTRHALYDIQGELVQELSTQFSNEELVAIHCSSQDLYLIYEHGLILKSPLSKLGIWSRLDLPIDAGFVKRAAVSEDRLMIYTTRAVWEWVNEKWVARVYRGASLYEWVYAVHAGYWPGIWMKGVNDLTVVLVVILIVSGLVIACRTVFKKQGVSPPKS